MEKKITIQPKGQSLVLLGVLAVALLIFLALIIDGGNAYAMRRLAQNAADAGALAGARDLCLTGDQTTAANTANKYAVQNNLARLGNVTSQTASVSVGGGMVDVITNIVYDTFFARIIGMDQMTAVAEAEAGCFTPGAGEGVIPIAWKCLPPGPDTPPDVDCDMQFTDTDSCSMYQGYKYYVFINSDDEPFVCEEWPPGAKPDDGVYIELVCDTNGDGDVDIEIVNTLQPQKGWMWVDLTGQSADAADLKDIVEGSDEVKIEVPTWVQDASGNKVSIYDAVFDFHNGDTIAVPVYDRQCTGRDPSDPITTPNCIGKYESGDNVILSSSRNDNTYNFRIVTFALLHIQCVESGSHGPCPGRTALNDASDPVQIGPQYNSFEGCFKYGFDSGITGIPSDGGVNAGAWTIYLTK